VAGIQQDNDKHLALEVAQHAVKVLEDLARIREERPRTHSLSHDPAGQGKARGEAKRLAPPDPINRSQLTQ
jgi:hypothetical protein